MSGTILVPLDGSALAERALPFAVTLSKKEGGRLVLVRAEMPHAVPGTRAAEREPSAVQEAEAYLESMVARLKADGLNAEPHVYYEEAAHAIGDAIKRQGAEMVVMSTHGRSGLGRWIYGSVAEAVLRSAGVPVLLIPASCGLHWDEGHPFRILVPLDESALAATILAPALKLAHEFKGELVLLEAVEDPATAWYAGTYSMGYYPFDPEPLRQDALSYLNGLAGQIDAKVETEALVGPAAWRIAEVANERQIDVIAMATHGRSGITRLVMGSVATRVLHMATRPLLLLRPEAAVVTSVAPETTEVHAMV